MTYEIENKALREEWFAKYWGGHLYYEDVLIEDGAAVLQQMGLIPTIKDPIDEVANKVYRDEVFATRFGGELECDGIHIDNGALVLQQMGVIATI